MANNSIGSDDTLINEILTYSLYKKQFRTKDVVDITTKDNKSSNTVLGPIGSLDDDFFY